jgi:hypothetical protein
VTERWRKKLEGIGQVAPRDDVYERAKAGPRLPEAQSPMQRTSTRVATAIAAFVVFALAISLFIVPTLRLHDDSSALSAGGQLLPLWPVRTVEQVQALQDEADAGRAGWALDPQQVATRFGQAVMAWPDASASPSTLGTGCNVASGPYPSGSYAARAFAGYCPADYAPTAYPPPETCDPSMLLCGGIVPQPGSSSSSAGRSMTLQLVPCDPTVCGQASFSETVEVFQPLEAGEGNVWSVLEVSSSSIDLAVSPGQTVSNESSVSTGLRIAGSQQFGFGVHVGASASCSLDTATDVFHGPMSADGLTTAAGSELTTDFGTASGTSCQQAEPGYVFVATSERTIVSGGVAIDPLQGAGGPGLLLTSFAAVPITFEWADGISSSSAPTPTTTTGWTTYTDPLGWTIDVPDGWSTGTIAPDQMGSIGAGGSGAWFSSGEPLPIPSGVLGLFGPDPAPGQVILRVFHDYKNPVVTDDSPFPLDADALLKHQGNEWDGFFIADGLEFGVATATGGGGSLSQQQHEVIWRMISSMRFQPWTPGETRGDPRSLKFTALDPTANRPATWKQAGLDWQELGGLTYVYMENGENGVLLGPMPSCGADEVHDAGTNVRAALLECADGTKGGWTIDGQPLPNNSRNFLDPVGVNHVVRAWDGTLLSPLVASQ